MNDNQTNDSEVDVRKTPPNENFADAVASPETFNEESAPAPEKLSTQIAAHEAANVSDEVKSQSATVFATVKSTEMRERERSDDVERQMRTMSRRSFLWGALAVGAGFGGLGWVNTRRKVDGLPWPLRQSHEFNTQISQDFFSSTRLAPTFLPSQISAERVNGDVGLGDDFDVSTWKLNVKGLASGEDLSLSLRDIQKLPRVEMTTEMKCIEGWSVVVHWTGARFLDFARKFPPATQSGQSPNFQKPDDLAPFVGISTPDEAYYVGLDLASALHPQTLLCWAMNGKALTPEHGAPLRLVTPVKYGIKHIKRIGTIEYSNARPKDYWAEQGYDWGSGH